MRVVYSEAHEAHAPETFLSRGVLSPCPETPERAARLLAALTEAGYAVQAPREFGAEPLATVPVIYLTTDSSPQTDCGPRPRGLP